MQYRTIKLLLVGLLLMLTAFPGLVSAQEGFDEMIPPDLDQQPCAVQFKTEDLTGNRSNGIPNNTLQVAVWYDGHVTEEQELYIEIANAQGITGWIVVGGQNDRVGFINNFSNQITTREYEMGECTLTGKVMVKGVIPNGVIDGMAFGLLHKNAKGQYRLYQSHSTNLKMTNDYVGMWPLGFNDATFAGRVPQVTTGFGREVARTLVTSAKYLDDGVYVLP